MNYLLHKVFTMQWKLVQYYGQVYVNVCNKKDLLVKHGEQFYKLILLWLNTTLPEYISTDLPIPS